MRKVLLVHISSSGCCNTLVTMLNNGDFGFPYCATPAFSTPAVWCRVFQSRVFQSRVFSRPLRLAKLLSENNRRFLSVKVKVTQSTVIFTTHQLRTIQTVTFLFES